MRLRSMTVLMPCAIALWAVGCAEPDYRMEVTGNGQGGVETRRVAKDPVPAPQPDATARALPPVRKDLPIERQIEQLEEQKRQIDLQITRLKLQAEAAKSSQ